MPASSNNVASRRRRKKVLKMARGYIGPKSKQIKQAYESVDRAGVFAYRDRKTKKRNFRSLWIVRINAACRLNGISYSRFMSGLHLKKIEINRKVLADMAVADPQSFTKLVETVKA